MTVTITQRRSVARPQTAFALRWRPFSLWRGTPAHNAWRPRVDVCESDDDVVATAASPGYETGDPRVVCEDGTLAISGERGTQESSRSGLTRERRQGGFCRSVALPVMVNTEHASARHENGALVVRAPRRRK